MGSIKYRTCSFEGTRAAAILTFREAVAQAVADVQTEVAKLDNLTTTRRDEAVVLVGQTPSTLLKDPLILSQAEAIKRNQFAAPPYTSLVVRSRPEGQGAMYRRAPFIEKQYDTLTADGTLITQGRGGLREAFETSFGHWLFQNPDGTQSAATDDLTDSSFFGKSPLLFGTAPSTSDGGPLGYSRTFSPSTYFTIPTGAAITTVSQSLMLIRGDMAAWGWVKPASSSERVILSFSSDPDPPSTTLTGTATVTNGSPTVMVTAISNITRYCRIIFSSQPDRVYEVAAIAGSTLTLSESYVGTSNAAATMLLAYSKTMGVVHPPETRNTLYALSVQQQGFNAKVRLYWQHHNRVTVEALNTNVAWAPGQYLFAGFQRRQRKLAGTVSRARTFAQFQYTLGAGGLLFQAKTAGPDGNLISFELRNNGPSLPLTVSTSGSAVTIQLQTDGGGLVLSTMAQIAAAVTANFLASQLLTCTATGTSSTVAAFSSILFLSGGTGNVVTGTGTNFTTEFGTGVVSNKYIRFASTGIGDLDGSTYYRIASVASDTSLTLDVADSKPFTGEYFSQRIMIHVGKLDGTFNTQIIDHLPGPTGGLEPEPVTRNILADFHIGRDFQYGSSTNFTGSMNVLSMYLQPIDTSDVPGQEDLKIRRMFSRCFPDYIAAGKTINRSVISDITDGQTVYCDYDYATGTTSTRKDTDVVTGHLDDILSSMNNPNVKTTSQLAQTIGTPDPALQDDIDQLNRSMSKYGMLVANGQTIIKGTTDMSAYNALALTIGTTAGADKLILNKAKGSFVLVAITEDVKEVQSVDSCGRPSTTVVITERIVGVNRNLHEAAISAGFSDTAPLKLKLWWIGAVGNTDASIQKMRLIGMTGAQIADAMSVTQSEKMKVYIIPVPDIGKKLRDSGVSNADLDAISTRTPSSTSNPATGAQSGTATGTPTSGDITRVNTDPGVGATATAVQTAMAAPAGLTVDGDPSPLDPALVTARTIDLGKALKSRIDDLITTEVLNAADADCQALIAIVDDMLQNLTRTLQQVNQAIVPFALHEKASAGNHKLAFDKYVPCVANVSASFALPPFHIKIDLVVTLIKHLLEQASAVVRQASSVVERFNTLLCIPKTLIAALRGGVCGIEQPKVVANRQCPSELDLLLDRLQALVDTIELLLRKVLLALTSFAIDVELSGGAASKLAIDATLPCIGPVANFLLALG